ncbi:SpoIIE family protein phosphatase, partial [bacterium]|nr:SpoIIE family protein phosphatase [bacterium]
LVLYTDGVTELENPNQELFGSERFLELLWNHSKRSAEDMQTALLTALKDFRQGQEPSDDVSFLFLRRLRLDQPL